MVTESLLDIPYSNVGILRSNHKFCFPCDNSVIRIDKHQVGARRIGGSLIIKDNLTFGIKESEQAVENKIEGEDELLNMEVRKAMDRRCELWVQFENGARMHVAMVDEEFPKSNLIPPAD